MAAELNPNAQEYYPSSFLPPNPITHHPIHLPYSTYSNILHYPPLSPSTTSYFFTSSDTTFAYYYELPPPLNPNVFPADFSFGDCTTTQPYYPNVNFNDMGLCYYHHWQQTRIQPLSLPLVTSYSSSPVLNQTRVLELSSTTDEADYHHHHHQHQQAIAVAAIASDDGDQVGNKEIIAERYEKEQPFSTSVSPPYERGSRNSSRKKWMKGFNGKPVGRFFYRICNNSMGSTSYQHQHPGAKVKSILRPMVYSEGKIREDDEVEPVQQDSNKTTVMIKNIPNQYTRKMLIEFLDKHCQSENEKAKLSSTDKESLLPQLSAYDFVYLPIDFCTDANKGYAFVNFTNPTAVWKLDSFLNKYEWNVLNTKKIARVTYAKRQGKDALVNYFEGTEFYCESDESLPVCFVPYRDGSEKEMVKLSTVGTCLGYRKECYRPRCRCHFRHQK